MTVIQNEVGTTLEVEKLTIDVAKGLLVVWLNKMKFRRSDWNRYFTEFTPKRLRLILYTDSNVYSIVVALHPERDDDKGYLGCTASRRKPLAGEDHGRGSDLADGEFNYSTWVRILGDIVSYELVSKVKSKEEKGINEAAEEKMDESLSNEEAS